MADRESEVDALFEVFAPGESPGLAVCVLSRGKPFLQRVYGPIFISSSFFLCLILGDK